ncbi:unannotated protein [freshwater metagenome]|uniref:Unannotated protein n=1 Tax=freshwater metagenome TaxID=449393 RepID=A0A6J6UQR0_9ZZZZ
MLIGPLSLLPASCHSFSSDLAFVRSKVQNLQIPALNPGMPFGVTPADNVRTPSKTFWLICSRSTASEMACRSLRFFSPPSCGSVNPKSKWYEPSNSDFVVLPYFDCASEYLPEGIVALMTLPASKSV